ncbi:MAG: alcohol dehydrogenase catalytic domain-containing protein [Burkholderiales bacterium]|nr:alcohol dehydrogenase catalytic domain-containing protein [Burkholderiales bacterium]
MQSYDITEWGKPLQKALRDTPVPTGTEVLVRVKYCGVCHSDVHIRDGYFDMGGGKKFHMSDRGMKPPVTMGHEPYGTVVAAGPEAGAVPIGQDRLVFPWTGCGKCARCLEGADNLCPTPRYLGIQRPGGYADHMLVPHPRYLVDATGVDPLYAPILACSGLTTYSAVNKLKPFPADEWILVMGAGGLGLMAVAMLRAMGHERIASCDIDPSKFGAARAAGAAETFNPADADTPAKLLALPGGVCGAVDLVGATQTAQVAMGALRKGGKYVIVGLYGGEIALSMVGTVQRALTVQGSYVGNVAELREVVALARSGKLKAIPVEKRAMSEISRTLDELKAGTVIGRVVAEIA